MKANNGHKIVVLSLCAASLLLCSSFSFTQRKEVGRGLASCEAGEDQNTVFPSYEYQGNGLFQMMNAYREKFQSTDYQLGLAQIQLNDLVWQTNLRAEYQKQYLGIGLQQNVDGTNSYFTNFRTFQPSNSLVASSDIWSNLSKSFHSTASIDQNVGQSMTVSEKPMTLNAYIGNSFQSVGFRTSKD